MSAIQAAVDKPSLAAIALRLAALPSEQRARFRAALQSRGISFAELPIVPRVCDSEAPLSALPSLSPLSYAQQRLWFLEQLAGPSEVYNIATALRLSGTLDVPAFKGSFEDLVARHAALRTAIVTSDGAGAQQIHASASLPWTETDLSGLCERERINQADAIGHAMARIRFDLEQPPLLRLHLARLAPDEHVLWLTLHHIVADGWSLGIIVSELQVLYAERLAGRRARLAELPISYADYANWQREWLTAETLAVELDYWKKQIGDGQALLALPADRPRPAEFSHRGAQHCSRISGRDAAALQALAAKHGGTLFSALLALFNVLLFRYTGQRDILVGTPVANRQRAETQGLIGLLANTIVIKSDLDGRRAFADFLAAVNARVIEAQSHQELPFEQLVDALQVPRSLAHSPLFQVMLTLHPRGNALTLPGLRVQEIAAPRVTAKFDLAVEFVQQADGLAVAWIYAADLFDTDTITRMAEHFAVLLQGVLAAPAARLDSLPLLGSAERRTLAAWNATERDYPRDALVHELIERRAHAQPRSAAVVFRGQTLTYGELNARANQLAYFLRSHGLERDAVVGVCMLRSIEMVVALLGVLKAGAAYLPLDPEYPAERLQHMVRHAGMRVLLTTSATPVPSIAAERTLALDSQWSAIAVCSTENPGVALDARHLAYVIYTSGSTGKPKGVAISHVGLLNRLQWMQAEYRLAATDCVLQKTPFSFDVSVWEFFWPLMTGAVLVVAEPGDHRDSGRLVQLIRAHGVTTLHFVPSMLRAFLAEEGAGECASIRRVICSGEALPLDLERHFFRTLAAELHNLYGPTEASIDVSYWACERASRLQSVPIGRPIANTSLYVLDAALNPAPIGMPGELHIGGVGLARGYLADPALTADRFIPDPFAQRAGSRLYRTGDLARWRADGAIEYLGRLDQQVKIRGFRIELGEVEARLGAHPAVAETVVMAREDGSGGKHLVGYWVARAADLPADEALRAFVRETLPEHMVPAAYMRLPALPLSPNGKLDRKALPAPDFFSARTDHAAPRTQAEHALAQVWQEVLGTGPIGLHDNFFRLGGDSILSLQVIATVRRAGWRLTPKQIFEHQTLAAAAAAAQRIAGHGTAASAGDAQRDGGGESPLTPIQCWFFATDWRHRQHWNHALALKVAGRLAPRVVEQAIRRVVARHTSLRAGFRRWADGSWTQTSVAEADDAIFECVDLRDSAALDCVEAVAMHGGRLQQSLDIEQGPLFRAAYMLLPDTLEPRLLLAAHHLCIDAVSWRILLQDLATACAEAAAGVACTLPAPVTSYGQWAQLLRSYAASSECRGELDYWRGVCQAAAPAPEAVAETTVGDARFFTVELDEHRTQLLLGAAPARLRAGVQDLLLTALAQCLCTWQATSAAFIELEGHGREELDAEVDLSRTLGWFTTRYPVYLQPPPAPLAALKAVKEQLRRVPRNGIGYGLLRYLADEPTRAELAAFAAPWVCFNYLGRFDGTFNRGGIFSLAPEVPGATRHAEERRTHALDVDAQVLEDKLAVQWTYSPQLHAEQAIAAVARDFMVRLELLIDALMAAPIQVTPADFPAAHLSQGELDELAWDWSEIDDVYPLSPMQQGLLLHTVLQPGSGIYLMQERYLLEGAVDPGAFVKAWGRLLERHAILRTSFVQRADLAPLQRVHRHVDGAAQTLDWRGWTSREQEEHLSVLLETERRDFDPARAPLLVVRLIRVGERKHWLVQSYHHLLLDAWSFSVLMGEFVAAYRAFAQSREPTLPAVAPYRSYIASLADQDLAAARSYWREALADIDVDAVAKMCRSSAGLGAESSLAEERLLLDAEESAEIAAAAQAHDLTLSTLCQAAWTLLLATHGGSDEVVCGVTVAGRPEELRGAQRMVGLFINTLPARVRINSQLSVVEWLARLQRQNAEMRQHQQLPLREIQALSPGGSGASLFEALYVFENTPSDPSRGAELSFSFTRCGGSSHTHYPLMLAISPGPQLSIELTYDMARLAPEVARLLPHQYRWMLNALIRRPQQRLGELRWIAPDEQARVLKWGQAAAAPGYDAPVHRWIQRQAARDPGRAALVLDERTLSYRELDERSSRIAQHLLALGCLPDTPVALSCQRSFALVIGVLGILKAGAAYLALESSLPAERAASMCEDAGVSLILATLPSLPRWRARADMVAIDIEAAMETGSGNPLVSVAPESSAYLIYTSGSTGRPKGVRVTHGALARHVEVMRDVLALTARDRVLQFSSLGFDASIDQLFPALTCGATLVLRGDAAPGSSEILELLRAQAITVADFPTTYWLRMLREMPPTAARALPALRLVSVGGEALPAEIHDLWQRAGFAGGVRLLNAYGPTEATVTATLHSCEHAVVASPSNVISIGQPLPGREVYVLDSALRLLPAGVAGELYIGGELLARGYHGAVALTAERFVPNPWGAAGSRLYRTGDRAAWQADGTLQYLGRGDGQVKLRGYRIELGEIEAELKRIPGVQEAAVVLHEDRPGEKKLVAYLSAAQAMEPEALRSRLAQRLPEYAIPAAFVALRALPVTASGKLERRALPAPALENTASLRPRSATERTIAGIWQELLGIVDIGVGDHFFRSGGDSITALQAVSRMRRAGLDVTAKLLFQYPTIELLAPLVRVAGKEAVHESARGAVPLTPIQHWFFAQNLPRPEHWNQSLLLAPRTPIEMAALRTALNALVAHHDALRLRFIAGAESWQQSYAPQAAAVEVRDLFAASPQDFHSACTQVEASLDLSAGKLLAAALIRGSGSSAVPSERLLIAAHHLVVDGVSWRILLEDLHTGYAQALARVPVVLPPATASYQAWSRYVTQHASSAALQSELTYWQHALRFAPRPTPPAAETLAGTTVRRIQVALDVAETRSLLTAAAQAYRAQPADLLLCALVPALCRGIGGSQLLVELEGHGREELSASVAMPDVSRTVGWFTSRFPMCIADWSDPAEGLRRVKEQLRAVPRRGAGWGVLEFMAAPQMRTALAKLPRPQVSFNYLGMLDAGAGTAEPFFAIAAEAGGDTVAPENPRSHAIDVVCAVVEQRLQVSWTYSEVLHATKLMQGIAEDYLQQVRDLIAHCAQQPPTATPSDFPLAALSQRELDALPVAAIEDIYPLSPMQQGMLFHALAAEGEDVYVNQLHCLLRGELRCAAFETAWREAVARHEIFRTSFIARLAGEPLQCVWRAAPLAMVWHDWRALDAHVQDSQLAALLEADRRRGFKLEQPPLLRFTLIRIDERSTRFIWTSHHALLDGWSASRLAQEVFERYHEICGGAAATVMPARRYSDYIEWIRRHDAASCERHWRTALAELSAPLLLADAFAVRPAVAAGYRELRLELDVHATLRLTELARVAGVTLSACVQAAWAALLSFYTARRDVVFGATTAGRPAELAGLEGTIGLFINTLPMFCDVDPRLSLSALARQLGSYYLDTVLPFEASALADIQCWICGGGQALFDTLVVFENYPLADAAPAFQTGLTIEVQGRQDRTNYPLTMNVLPGERLTFEISYQRDAFDDGSMQRLGNHWLQLLAEASARPAAALGDLCALTASEIADLERWGCGAESPQPAADCFALFERQAQRRPDALAVRCDAGELTYRELHERADRLGRILRAHGIGQDAVVVLCDERGIDFLVMLLAVYRAQAAYLPLDPRAPARRQREVLEASGARWVVLGAQPNTAVLEAVAALNAPPMLLRLDELERAPIRTDGVAPAACVHAHALGYVIYTSGSTGMPKGAMVEHSGMMNTLLEKHVQLQLSERDVVAQTAPACFDISVWQFLSGLLCGATIEIISDAAVRDPALLLDALVTRSVTVLEAVPGLIHALLDEPQRELALRWLLPTGEALPPELARRWLRRYPQIPLLNAYGPAECADDAAIQRIDTPPPAQCAHMPIGSAVANLRLQIVNEWLQLLPVGIAGELCIAGRGVGRGYLNDPRRTAEAFVPNPFARVPGERMYHTGDLVRQRPDGIFEYLGREDQQVKVRGHRIELGEIEAKLLAEPIVEEAVVLAHQDERGEMYLVAYVTGAGARAELLKAALGERLPIYMVPNAIVVLTVLPRNANGKIDRRALRSPGRLPISARAAYVAPATAVEALLANVWSEVLGRDPIGAADNFFELGGHSLLAVRAMQRTRQLLQRELPLMLLFNAPTVAQLAQAVMDTSSARASPLIQLQPGDGTRAPLFCIHPAGGHIASYLPLVDALDAGFPVYGVQSRSLGDPHWRDASIASMARDYVAAIRAVYPRGPVRLLGWSMGGTIAMAMAALLEHSDVYSGCAVEWVALLDTTHFSNDATAVQADHARECMDYLRGLARGSDEQAMLVHLEAELSALAPEQQLSLLVARAQACGFLPADVDREEIALRLAARHDSYRLLREHAVERIAAPIYLWQASATVLECTPAELDWSAYSPEVRISRIEGDHLQVVRSTEVAGALNALLARPATQEL